MRTSLRIVGVAALAVAAALPALAAKDPKEAKKKDGPVLRYQHTYAAAIEEAKERGCVIFATFHIDH